MKVVELICKIKSIIYKSIKVWFSVTWTWPENFHFLLLYTSMATFFLHHYIYFFNLSYVLDFLSKKTPSWAGITPAAVAVNVWMFFPFSLLYNLSNPYRGWLEQLIIYQNSRGSRRILSIFNPLIDELSRPFSSRRHLCFDLNLDLVNAVILWCRCLFSASANWPLVKWNLWEQFAV